MTNMPTYQFLVSTNPQSGKEDEYNRWYSEQHLADLLKIPGIVAAQRFRVADDNGKHPHRYLAVYQIETDDIDAVMADINSRVGTAAMPLSDAMDSSGMAANLFVAITDRKLAVQP
jgi:hypothetical protein